MQFQQIFILDVKIILLTKIFLKDILKNEGA